MNRLFCVKNRTTEKMALPHGCSSTDKYYLSGFFKDKMEAKKLRDELGTEHWYVAKGPDHIGNHGSSRVPRMRRQPK